MNTPTRARASRLFAALAHPARLRIVELLFAGEKTVNEVAQSVQLSQSGTSQHLAILTRAGVLAVEPHGTARVYRVRGPRIARILALIEEFCQVHELYGVPDESDADLASENGVSSVGYRVSPPTQPEAPPEEETAKSESAFHDTRHPIPDTPF